MVHGLAATGLEFRRAAPRRRERRLLGPEATCAHHAGAGARVQVDRTAEEQRDRIRDRLLRCGHRLRTDLAHLVAGRSGADWRFRRAAGVRVSRQRGGRDPGHAHCPVRSHQQSRGRSMNITVAIDEARPDAVPAASEAGPAPKRIVVAYGFWIFLLSDIVMFSALFAAYAVLVRAT